MELSSDDKSTKGLIYCKWIFSYALVTKKYIHKYKKFHKFKKIIFITKEIDYLIKSTHTDTSRHFFEHLLFALLHSSKLKTLKIWLQKTNKQTWKWSKNLDNRVNFTSLLNAVRIYFIFRTKLVFKVFHVILHDP